MLSESDAWRAVLDLRQLLLADQVLDEEIVAGVFDRHPQLALSPPTLGPRKWVVQRRAYAWTPWIDVRGEFRGRWFDPSRAHAQKCIGPVEAGRFGFGCLVTWFRLRLDVSRRMVRSRGPDRASPFVVRSRRRRLFSVAGGLPDAAVWLA
jgi:hypothetical protein